MDRIYKLSVKQGDVSFEIESSDVKWLEKKESDYWDKLIKGGQPGKVPATKTLKTELQQKSSGLPSNLTINEFYKKYIKNSKIKSRPDIAVFFVYYLEKIQKAEGIRTQDVAQRFSNVGYPNWNKLNMTDILNQAKKKALLNYVNNLWSLTITGEDFVLNTISGENE